MIHINLYRQTNFQTKQWQWLWRCNICIYYLYIYIYVFLSLYIITLCTVRKSQTPASFRATFQEVLQKLQDHRLNIATSCGGSSAMIFATSAVHRKFADLTKELVFNDHRVKAAGRRSLASWPRRAKVILMVFPNWFFHLAILYLIQLV